MIEIKNGRAYERASRRDSSYLATTCDEFPFFDLLAFFVAFVVRLAVAVATAVASATDGCWQLAWPSCAERFVAVAAFAVVVSSLAASCFAFGVVAGTLAAP